MKNNKIFSFDAETDGLWGDAFAIAAIVYEKLPSEFGDVHIADHSNIMEGDYKYFRPAMQEEYEQYGHTKEWGNGYTSYKIVGGKSNWVETDRFMALLPSDNVKNGWVRENVLPALGGIIPTHESYEEMLSAFSKFYMKHKAGADCICHMGYIVEAHVLREMRRLGFIGEWDAPYPLFDVSGNLQAAGEDPTSVDTFAKNSGLKIAEYGTTHNPLYDCEVAGKVYIRLTR